MEENYWDNVSDNYLVERIRLNDCEKSLNELIKRHSPLCFKILKKYSSSFFANNIDMAETSMDKNLIIWNSAKSFSIHKNVKFSTWLANQTKYFCLNTLNKKNKDRLVTAGDEILDYFNEDNTALNNLDFANFLDYVENILSQLKDKRIKTWKRGNEGTQGETKREKLGKGQIVKKNGKKKHMEKYRKG